MRLRHSLSVERRVSPWSRRLRKNLKVRDKYRLHVGQEDQYRWDKAIHEVARVDEESARVEALDSPLGQRRDLRCRVRDLLSVHPRDPHPRGYGVTALLNGY